MNKTTSDKYLIDTPNGQIECIRVTKVLGATKASAGLANWYGMEERKGILELLRNGNVDAVTALDTTDYNDLFGSRLRDSKAHSGTGIHALIYADATNTKIPDDIVLIEDDWNRYQMWEAFKTKEEIEYVEAEQKVYSQTLLVAGTMDMSFLWHGVLWAFDTKTGALRRDAAVQVVTYWLLRYEMLARQEGNKERIQIIADAYASGRIPPINWPRFGILHVGDENIEIYEIDPELPKRLAAHFLFRLQVFRDDQIFRPFRRIFPEPRRLKNKEFQEVKWLRAS